MSAFYGDFERGSSSQNLALGLVVLVTFCVIMVLKCQLTSFPSLAISRSEEVNICVGLTRRVHLLFCVCLCNCFHSRGPVSV